MIEIAIVAFTTVFAAVGPVEVALLLPAITPNATAAARRRMALKGTAVATAILLVVAAFGNTALAVMGISLPSLQIAGGILLLILAIDMVFARHSGFTATTVDESNEAAAKADISVFPLATPLIAGPGAIGAVILLIGRAGQDWSAIAVVVGAIGGVMLLTLFMLLAASGLRRVLGLTGLNVVTRVFGVALAALAVQFMVDGVRASSIFAS
jgi:multiple antibiotic resistance protein